MSMSDVYRLQLLNLGGQKMAKFHQAKHVKSVEIVKQNRIVVLFVCFEKIQFSFISGSS